MADTGGCTTLPDSRDYLYAAPLARFPQGLPISVDLRSEFPPAYNQGQSNACTANAIAGAMEFDQKKQGNPDFIPSRLFIYYNARVIEGTTDQDSGAAPRDGIKAVATLGAPPETDWQFDITRIAERPPTNAYTDASQDIVSKYSSVAQDISQMKGCLAEGFPFIFGFTVYQTFESDEVKQTGVVPMPSTGEAAVQAHCAVVVGYDDTERVFYVRNSWGQDWGMAGYCTMPYEYLLSPQLADDFWTIRSVTG